MLVRVVILLSIILSGCASDKREGEIRIGAIASLTGPAGEQGRQWFDGALVAAREYKESGVAVRLLVEDDGTTTAGVTKAFQRLVAIEGVQALIGGTWDYLFETAVPLAERAGIPFLSPTNPAEIFSAQAREGRCSFSSGMSLAAVREQFERFIAKRRPQRIALVFPGVPFGIEQARLMNEVATKAGVAVVVRREFPIVAGYEENLKLAALDIQREKADAVFAVIDYSGVEILLRELDRLTIRPTFLTTQHLDRAFEISKNRALFTDAFGVYPAVSYSKEFQAVHARVIRRPVKVYSAEGYDTMRFLVEAIRAGVPICDPAAIFSYSGMTGEFRLPAAGRQLVAVQGKIMSTASGKFEAVSW